MRQKERNRQKRNWQNRTASLGLSGQDSQSRTARTGQPGHDSRKGQPGADSQERTARTVRIGLLGQNSNTGLPGQDCQEMTAKGFGLWNRDSSVMRRRKEKSEFALFSSAFFFAFHPLVFLCAPSLFFGEKSVGAQLICFAFQFLCSLFLNFSVPLLFIS